MAAFDKVKSGYPGLDDILDYIRIGDNVVWLVNDIDEFRFFCAAICEAGQTGWAQYYLRPICAASSHSGGYGRSGCGGI